MLPPLLDPLYDPPREPWLTILHEDQRLIVLDKPTGLLTVPGKDPKLFDSLETRVQRDHPTAKVVHRLDRDTSGVLLMAFDKGALGVLGQQFEQRRVQKSYVARVWGNVEGDSGLIDMPLATDWDNKPRQRVDWENGRPSRTEWTVIGREDNVTRLRLVPLTGRTHQLRVHLLAIGHPILGDAFYASGPAYTAVDRLQLHAERLVFFHPDDLHLCNFVSPTPF